jgi:ElaA protein
MPEITTEWRRFDELTAAELYELLRFRQSIFVVEQASPYPDLDGLDQGACHLLLRDEGQLSGCLRLIPNLGRPPLVRIGKVAIAAQLRRHGLGRTLMEEALRLYREHYPARDIALGAQAHLVPFYRGFGFEPTGEPYDDFGISHIEMSLRRSA